MKKRRKYKLKINFTIPIPPITKKNSQRIFVNKFTGRHFVAPSKQYKNYEKSVRPYIPKTVMPLDIPLNVKCLFYMPTKRRCDLTNLLEAIDDIMVKYGLIKDDEYNIITSHDGSRVMVDRENPRTEVEIVDNLGQDNDINAFSENYIM